jgi:hypothetical protein
MTHDPLCPAKNDPDPKCHSCHLIDKVREDMLAKCITLIEESPWSSGNWIAVDERAAILTALRGLREQP